ncbi:TBC1 domain family member 13 protein [Thraustotheca clavata]|uniref:TBC1 domain family member 13 protein n=1 Tax=Thraustotheca clavata TaxID=74557 RepID=A0A1V9Z7E2_9STRA|nr:TBC1 domain family member 13 protein [Thraustotheca clavata]
MQNNSLDDKSVRALLETSGSFNYERVQDLVFQGLDNDVAIRPIAWRILLGLLGNRSSEWPIEVAVQRQTYARLQNQYLPPAVDNMLYKDIQKDVARTHIELSCEGIEWMLRILFVFAKAYPDVGYTQGMHEVLAPIIYVFSSDKAAEWKKCGEADAYAVFGTLMKALAPLHLPSKSTPSKTGVQVQMLRLNTLLRQHDARLWQHLNSVALTPDYYSFRWYITLFAREFPIVATLQIWDSLLADKKRFAFLHYVCVALIISHRTALLDREADFGCCLTILQSEPMITVQELLKNAVRLRDIDRAADNLTRINIETRRALSPRAKK